MAKRLIILGITILALGAVVRIAAAESALDNLEYGRIDSVPLEALFAYDKNLPFNVEKKVIRESATTITYSIYYDSSHEERVPAVLTVPKREGPHPLVVFSHGHGMEKDLGPMADVFIGGKGYALFGIDAEYRNEREREGHDIISPFMYSCRDAVIQTVVDNMRGLDYLETLPEIDMTRVGLMGLSMGSYIGAVLFSQDRRIRTAAFGVGGADWRKVGEKSIFGPLYQLKQSGRPIEEFLGAFRPVDPLNHVWRSRGRPVLLVNGRLDELVPPEAAKALYAALAEPKHIVWFDGGHVPSMDTIMDLVNDMLDWFGKYLKPKRYYKVPETENAAPTAADLRVLTDEIRQNEKVAMSVRASDDNGDIIFVKAFFDCGDDVMLMNDDGKGADETADDGVYTGRYTIYEKAGVGKSLVHVKAVDRWGAVSEELTSEIEVGPIKYPDGARPPVITGVVLPESAVIGKKIHYEIHADDPDKDLDQILITVSELGLTLSLVPDSSGSIIQDFGLPKMVPPGVYHFIIQAKDRTKMYSEPVEKITEIFAGED